MSRGAAPAAPEPPHEAWPDAGAPSWFTALLQLTDSALPTGAFSHSYGLEGYLHSGAVTEEHGLADWLDAYLDTQLTTTDALVVRVLYGDLPGVADTPAEMDALLTAALVPREIRQARVKTGRRLLELSRDGFGGPAVAAYRDQVDEGRCDGHFCLAFALVGRDLGVPLEVLLRAYAWSTLTSLVQNAVRAVPLGQAAGQRVLTRCRPRVEESVRRAMALEPRHFGATAPGLEIAQMRHEHQHARLFMS